MNKKIIILLILILFFFLLFLKQGASNDNILYIPDFLDEKDSKTILELRGDKDNFIFENFRYSKPLTDRSAYNIFYSDKYMNQIQHNLNKELYPSKFPIEHRYYSEDSQGMQWHKDLLMYKKPQYEAIYTIRNNTKSLTEWKDSKGDIHSIWTEPNSLLIVKANGYEHHVTKTGEGEREILKLIYTQTHETNNNYKKEMERFKGKY